MANKDNNQKTNNIDKFLKRLKKKFLQAIYGGDIIEYDIQFVIIIMLTIVTIITVSIMGLLLYNRFDNTSRQNTIENAEQLLDNTAENVDSKLQEIRQISNSIYYNIIQSYDISSQDFKQQLSLIYEVNKSKLQSIVIFDKQGNVLAAEPFISIKEDNNYIDQSWFYNATNEIENIHFSIPHIQNIFISDSYKFNWVISISRSIDIINGAIPKNGVLLVDMNYSEISSIMDSINEMDNGEYFYLCDSNGNLIYHPNIISINKGLATENSREIASLEDGIYNNKLNNENRTVIVNNISYTGWKLIGVIPKDIQSVSSVKFRYYFYLIICLIVMMLIVVNRLIARRVSRPILMLNESVKAYEAGDKPDIYIGGSTEIRHLGYSVQKSYEQIEKLMNEVIEEQNLRRKSEIDALQSQINPHFLYNTLESITWMIEAERNKDAITMITELGKLLRISLSKGRTIITIEDEIQHSRSYMNIQKIRYKERFKVIFDIDEEIYKYSTVKLIIQPILENAIYYGVGNMDADDGGMITIKGYKKDDGIYISVIDNGMGMNENDVKNILTDNSKVPKHGSGVGLINVHTRIQLMFGNEYGLSVISEPDEGTTVTIHLPIIEYNDDTRTTLEKAKIGKGSGLNEE